MGLLAVPRTIRALRRSALEPIAKPYAGKCAMKSIWKSKGDFLMKLMRVFLFSQLISDTQMLIRC